MGNVDQRNRLEDEVFTYEYTKNRKVFISWKGRQVTTLSGEKAERFMAQIQSAATPKEAQLVMAKATGHFKHGNEKASKPRKS